MKIKTLAEILAESDTDSASSPNTKPKKPAKHSYKDEPHKPRKNGKRPTYSNKNNAIVNDLSTNDSLISGSLIGDSTTDIDSGDPLLSSSINQKTSKSKKRQKREKRFHPAANFSPEPSDVPTYLPPEAQSIKEMLAEVKHSIHGDETDNSLATDTGRSTDPSLRKSKNEAELSTIDDNDIDNQNDNIPAALKAYLRTPEQKQAEIDAIKAESRLRWLAFYYLSRREYGKSELKQKLIDKEQNPEKVDALLDEFEEKGYQSDYRTTLMLIRENIRKGRGRGRIKQEFYRKKIAMPGNIDELIDMANAESEEFSEFVDDNDDNLVDGVDWLKLAVTARTKKYGDDIPVEQKDKAKQLRFLQYRGFNTDICFAALNYTLDTLDERF
ncbi:MULTISPECIES: regulatory protein RecX [unclassified Psychrobacter]|uniref:regulatory protein RecX n=1 Tax=unclassified Psychrobacter TaxID=196806 RepID=UPI0025B305F6|nr:MULTISPECIES: regulatory protein RecX [unclassified Psychrobacter]MDN3453957.1 regulatory protein RecX [Psychrobacter sp. APC 3350]MDN3502325.1 regulatory protein RecX [Psychrobacter sp. 5A.1]